MAQEILKLTGEITHIGEVQKGQYKKGKRIGEEWTAQDFVVKQTGKYPKSAALRVFNYKGNFSDQYKVKDFVEVCFNIASREYKEKWYTNLDAWEIKKLSDSASEIDFEEGKEKPQPEAGTEDNSGLPF